MPNNDTTLKITTTSLPDATVDPGYKQTLVATGGVAPLKWSVSPPLPDSLKLDEATGTISGKPTAGQAKTQYTFKVTDSATPANSATAQLTLEIRVPTNDTTTPMGRPARFWLTVYLLAATAVAGCGVLSLWKTAQSPGPPPVEDCKKATGPLLSHVHPDRVDVGSPIPVLLIGCGFPAETQAKFNGVAHNDFTVIDPGHIRVGLTAADVAAVGFIVVTLSKKDNKGNETEYGHGVITVSAPIIGWHFLGVHLFQISQELQLLLLVLFSGALGSSVYATKSLADYRGAGKLYGSWYSFYFIQPLEGAGIALIFYFAVRGGFMAGTGADVKAVNPFGMCAIAALAGAFSDIAFSKLREVFETLFKPKDDRPGKIEAGTAATTTPVPTTTAGAAGTTTPPPTTTAGGAGQATTTTQPPVPTTTAAPPATTSAQPATTAGGTPAGTTPAPGTTT